MRDSPLWTDERIVFRVRHHHSSEKHKMESGGEEQGGEPEVTVETVPDHIETGYSDEEPGILDYVKYYLLGYFSNPWALLILAFITYKLYRRLKPFLTEPLAERFYWSHCEREEETNVVLSDIRPGRRGGNSSRRRRGTRRTPTCTALRWRSWKPPDSNCRRGKNCLGLTERLGADQLCCRYNQDAVKAEEKRLEAEEEKREQEIKDWEDHLAGKGYKNKARGGVDSQREALEQQARVKGKKGFRPDDYNPLMGGGGSGGFRPAPRRLNTGGG